MPPTPPDIGQPTLGARIGREDRGERGNKWWTLVAVCLGTFMLLLDITIVNVALPDIQRALHSSFADLQWVVDAYALTLASFLLTAGSLADIYGRRVLYLIGLVVFTCASALCGFAASTLMLQLSRALQGAGGAIMFAVTVALSSLVYGLIESNQRSFTDGLVLGCFAAAVVLLVAFVVVELRSTTPMFDLNLFRLPTFSGGSVAAFRLSASIFSMLLYLVLYIQDILGYSPLGTGVRLMVISGGILLTSAVAGRLTSRVPIRLLIGPGLLIVGIGLLLMRGLDAGSAWTHLIPGMIMGGIGVGLFNPPLASTAVGVVAPQRAGMASGINSTFRQVGTATGIALLGTLFSNDVKTEVLTRTAAVPGLSARGPEIAGAVQSGQIGNVIARLPAPASLPWDGSPQQAVKIARQIAARTS